MTKGYYIVGTVLLGVGVYFLYNKIKNGNISFNTRGEDNIVKAEEGSHLNPPMEVPPLATPPLATTKLV
jgi:hypothetical protein